MSGSLRGARGERRGASSEAGFQGLPERSKHSADLIGQAHTTIQIRLRQQSHFLTEVSDAFPAPPANLWLCSDGSRTPWCVLCYALRQCLPERTPLRDRFDWSDRIAQTSETAS